MSFRRARAEDRQDLDDMTLAGLRFWGHDVNYPDAYQGLVQILAADDGPENHLVFVFEDGDTTVGFFELRDRNDHVELLRMFLRPKLIGQGYGAKLWREAVRQARKSHDRMLIMSDPGARGFYEAMGAVLESEVEVSPGFLLGRYWYELSPKGT